MVGPRQLGGRAGRAYRSAVVRRTTAEPRSPVHGDAVVAGDARYGGCYLRTLDWIVDAQADWAVGDWHQHVDHRGRPSGVKSGMWKDPYHQGRGLIECLELLRPAPFASPSRPI